MNFGEAGWNSRQSLNLLITLLRNDLKPNLIIAFEGVNEIMHPCRSEINRIPTTSYEMRIKSLLKPYGFFNLLISKFINNSFIKFLIEPYQYLFYALNLSDHDINDPYKNMFNCKEDILKSNDIADELLNNWYSAYLLSKEKDIQFIAILQPHLYNSVSYIKHINFKLERRFEKPLNVVYPLIKNKIEEYCLIDKNFCESILDATNWINTDKEVYLDYFHLSGDGNKIIAKEIYKNIKNIKNFKN